MLFSFFAFFFSSRIVSREVFPQVEVWHIPPPPPPDREIYSRVAGRCPLDRQHSGDMRRSKLSHAI